VQLPGRENRIAEPPFGEAEPLVRALADVLAAEGDSRPFALFGHSNGALISFELARELRRRGAAGPVHLFAAGRRAPDLPSGLPPIHHLPDEGFLAEIRQLGGLPPTLLEHPELLELLLPALRADVGIHERYRFEEMEPLDVPITTYAGREDPKVLPEQVAAWGRHTRSELRERAFAGGHFFLHEDRAAFLRVLSADLRDLLPR
jgi:medium-chain acyl-[acyl-carrier-protein] hydrolase